MQHKYIKSSRNAVSGLTFIELLIASALAGAAVLVLATLITFSTVENEKTRGQMEQLGDIAFSLDLLNQLLAQTTKVFDCNCSPNCLACSDPNGCAGTFPAPGTGQVPIPTGLGTLQCGIDDPYFLVEQQLGISAGDPLNGNCILHVEFEDLPAYPKYPSTSGQPKPLPNSFFNVSQVPPPANSPLLNGAPIQENAGVCNDGGQSAGDQSYYAAGCWKDLYVYYVQPTPIVPGPTLPGYIVFAITTTASRNGGTPNPPLQVYTVGTLPSQGSSVGSMGVVGVACGYVPAYRDDPKNSNMPGAGDPSLSGLAPSPLASGYANTPPAYPRSLEFEFYALTKVRQSDLESWSPIDPVFFGGVFRHLLTRVGLHNLSERGLHFLRLFASSQAFVSSGQAGHGTPVGCYGNNGTPPAGSDRSVCCSNAMNEAANKCVPCIPSGKLSGGFTQNCCSEQDPSKNGWICP